MLKPMLLPHTRSELLIESLAMRTQNAGIGTELVAHREKIEVTRRGPPFERSPVPMGRAHRRYTRAVCASPQRMPQTSDCVADRRGFELSVPFVNKQQAKMPVLGQ